MGSTSYPAARQALNDTEKLAILADLYESQGKYAEAEDLYRRILDIKEKALGPNDPGLAMDIHNLGLLCYVQDKYEEAEIFLLRALQLEEKAFGADDIELATTFDALAQLYHEQGKYAQAIEICQRALKICQDNYPAEDARLKLSCLEFQEFLMAPESDLK